jgi:hypothetical protein
METCKQLSPLVAAQQALARQQLVVLRDWLGDDHELLARTTVQTHNSRASAHPSVVLQPEEESA